MNSEDYHKIVHVIWNKETELPSHFYSLIELGNNSVKNCKCYLQTGAKHDIGDMLISCTWPVDDILQVISISLSTFSIAMVVNHFGLAVNNMAGFEKVDIAANIADRLDDHNKELGTESEENLDNENSPTKLILSAKTQVCWIFGQYKHILVKLIGILNVVFGISVSTYCVYTLALTDSVVFLMFIPFILFRAASPDSIRLMWLRIKSAYLKGGIRRNTCTEKRDDFTHGNAGQMLTKPPVIIKDMEYNVDSTKEVPVNTRRQYQDVNEIPDSDEKSHTKNEIDANLKTKSEPVITKAGDKDPGEIHEMKQMAEPQKRRNVKSSASVCPNRTKFDPAPIWRTVFLCFAPFFLQSVLTLKTVFCDIKACNNLGDFLPSKLGGFLAPIDQRFSPTVIIRQTYNDEG